MEKLFICHHTEYDPEVTALSEELQFRGVPTWVDHLGGFGSGDQTTSEARRVITDPVETFGMMIFATDDSISRPFISKIELVAATKRRREDSDYLLVPLPFKIGFDKVSALSRDTFGEDLTIFNGYQIKEMDHDGIRPADIRRQFADVAEAVLKKRVALVCKASTPETFNINLCTRQRLSAEPDDHLEIDVTRFNGSPDFWKRLQNGLVDLRKALRTVVAKPSIRIGGSKHLTAAFLVGRVFTPPTAREIITRQQDEYWTSNHPPTPELPFIPKVVDGVVDSDALFVEVTATDHDITPSVLEYSRRSGVFPHVSLRLNHKAVGEVDNATACAMAQQIREQVILIQGNYPVKSIHLFMAVPQAVATFMGRALNATLPIQLHEFSDGNYHLTLRVEQKDLG